MIAELLDNLADRWLAWRYEQNASKYAPELRELALSSIAARPGGWDATFVTPAAAVIADELAAMLDKASATNYVQFDFLPRLDRQGKPVRVTVQWAHGKSPAQRVTELEAQVAALTAKQKEERERTS